MVVYVRPICLPIPEDAKVTDIMDKYVEIAGWGMIDSSGDKFATVLQTIKVIFSSKTFLLPIFVAFLEYKISKISQERNLLLTISQALKRR